MRNNWFQMRANILAKLSSSSSESGYFASLTREAKRPEGIYTAPIVLEDNLWRSELKFDSPVHYDLWLTRHNLANWEPTNDHRTAVHA